jgi:hypothetical protein
MNIIPEIFQIGTITNLLYPPNILNSNHRLVNLRRWSDVLLTNIQVGKSVLVVV